MTWQLTPEEIAKYWKLIQYGAVMASGTTKIKEYSLGLLKNLMVGQYQCWFIIDGNRKIKLMAITRLNKDEGDTKYLVIDPVFGFLATTSEEQLEIWETVKKFSERIKADRLIGHISNPMMAKIALRLGMTKVKELYELKIGV